MIKTSKYHEITDLARRGQFDAARAQLDSADALLTASERDELLGNMAFYQRNLTEAVKFYETAMHRDKTFDCARYHYIVGVNEERKGNLEEASERYNTAIAIEPSFVDAYIELGGLMVRLGDYKLAATVYEDALKLDPDEIRLYYNLSEIYSALSDTDGAFEEKSKFAKRNLKQAKARLGPLPSKDYKW